MSRPWKSVGILASIGAVVLIGITAVDDAPPLQSLTNETYQVDDSAYLHKLPKAPTIAVLPAGGVELVIRNVCNGDECQVPREFKQLKRDDKITVWREGRTIWQAKVEQGQTYSYRQAVAEMNKAKATSYLMYGALLCVGLLVTLFTWRGAA
jgi:hypothetical protein